MRLLVIACTLGIAATLTTHAQPALTIYNQNFAVIRDTVPLNLQAGENTIRYTEATAHLEPDSVILRDPAGKTSLQILEQDYRNDPVSQDLLLSLCEGQTIDFQKVDPSGQGAGEIIRGKVIRSGYVPHYSAFSGYGYEYQQAQMAYAQGSQPIIEVNGKIRFGLPGQPLFPDLGSNAMLKPTLNWLIQAPSAARLDAEISYVTGGFNWEATYNLVAPEKGDNVDLIGWVTMDNQSGKTFENAKIKLMAGDVNKIQPNGMNYARTVGGFGGASDLGMAPPVSEKAFDDFHLYTLQRPTTLRDRETKQVEFVRANGIQTKTVYVYDGIKLDPNRYNGSGYENIRADYGYGTECNKKVCITREFINSDSNHLGMALPKGKLRFYRRDADGRLEFIGEDKIDHTPHDETIRVISGNAFDLVGERIRKNYNFNANNRWADETFEIKLRNHKSEPQEIRVVEHLYRSTSWEIAQQSDDFLKTDAQTIEFLVQVKPEEERTITYTVHYFW